MTLGQISFHLFITRRLPFYILEQIVGCATLGQTTNERLGNTEVKCSPQDRRVTGSNIRTKTN